MLAGMLVPTQNMRLSQFETLGGPEVDVVFLGDSLMDNGEWNEWFPQLKVANRGISGDTIGGVRRRVGSAIRVQRYVCIEVGTNDLSLGRRPSAIANDIAGLVADIHAVAPTSRIILNSVPPREKSYRAPVTALNRHLAALVSCAGNSPMRSSPGFPPDRVVVSRDGSTIAPSSALSDENQAPPTSSPNFRCRTQADEPQDASAEHSSGPAHSAAPSVTYLDLWPALATPKGTLRPDYTIDGLHLTGPGYAAWVECLRPLLV
jgi:lysophospholipase L1-like esterase